MLEMKADNTVSAVLGVIGMATGVGFWGLFWGVVLAFLGGLLGAIGKNLGHWIWANREKLKVWNRKK